MSIAQQIATPAAPAPSRGRRSGARLVPAPPRRTGYALARIAGLVSVTAVLTALAVGVVAIGLLVLASNLGG